MTNVCTTGTRATAITWKILLPSFRVHFSTKPIAGIRACNRNVRSVQCQSCDRCYRRPQVLFLVVPPPNSFRVHQLFRAKKSSIILN